MLFIVVAVDRWKAAGRKQRNVEKISACAESPCIRKISRMITEMRIKHVPVEVTYSPKYHTASSDRERAEQIKGERQRSCVHSSSVYLSSASSRFQIAIEANKRCTLMFIDSVVPTNNESSRSAPILPVYIISSCPTATRGDSTLRLTLLGLDLAGGGSGRGRFVVLLGHSDMSYFTRFVWGVCCGCLRRVAIEHDDDVEEDDRA